MKKSYILFLTLLFSVNLAYSQGFLGIKQSNYSGAQGGDLNPAHIADNRFVFDVTLGGLSQITYNDYMYFDTKNMPYWWARSFSDTTTSWHPKNDTNFFDNNFIRFDNAKTNNFISVTELDVLNFMFNINDSKIGIGAGMKIRSYTHGRRISNELIELLRSDFDVPKLWSQELQDINLDIATNTWAEYYINYAQVVLDKEEHFLKIGGKVKLLQGMGSAYVFTDKLNYEVSNEDTALYLQGNVQYGYSENLNDLINSDNSNSASDNISFSEIFQLQSKLGVGFDIGAIYEWRPDWEEYKYEMDGKKNLWRKDKNKYKLKVGISANDIGGMKYLKGEQTRNFVFDETNFDLNTFDDVENFSDFDSVANANFQDIDDDGTYYMNLPTSLSLQVDYHIWNDFYVNFTGIWALASKKDAHRVNSHSIYALTPRYDYKWAGFSIPLSYSTVGGFRFGLGLRMGPITVGVADLMPVFAAGKTRGADIYAALKLPILYGHPSDIDNDKVSDKLDLCLEDPGIWAFRGCPDTDKDSIQDSEDACPTIPGLPEFQGCPDSDGDGIKDSEDDCPHNAGPKENNGCPDRDKDGVLDMNDKCPDTPGLEIYDGCPDTDEDGIIDEKDLCPENAGPISNNGCPDTDKDGIFDYLDGCPEVAGPQENRGCPWPDTDEDGILDKDDKCPYVAGPASNDGCPYADTDKDSVVDKDDECVLTPGPVSNKGCPVIEEKEEEILKAAFDNLEFETAKAKIKERSHESLEELANLLLRKGDWKLLIAGHTDNQGGAQNNLILSKRRAEAVRDFLMQRGIDEERLIVQFFGEEKPIASNDTPEGRQKNRRVEMEILFK